jgi:hypothetical protein
MSKVRSFRLIGTELLESLKSSGLSGFSSNRKDYGTHVSVSTVWLCLGNGVVLRLQAAMHDLKGWDEVGSLVIETVEPAEALTIIRLADEWKKIASIEKLVVSKPGYFSAKSGLKISNRKHEAITICNSASPYELALSTPVTHDVVTPEYALDRYSVRLIFPE